MSSSSSLSIKQCLVKESNTCQIVFFIICCSVISIILLYHGIKELYIIKTLVIGPCYIKSIDLKIDNDKVYPLWFITVVYDNKKNEDIISGSTAYYSRHNAWNAAHDYRINGTYHCYRWKSLTSTSPLGWQWNKPPESNIGAFLFSGTVLLVLSIIIPILRRRYQTEFQIRQQQQQIAIPLANQPNSPPTYDEAIETLTSTTIPTGT